MESKPQNSEFRNNPENFHPCTCKHGNQCDVSFQNQAQTICHSVRAVFDAIKGDKGWEQGDSHKLIRPDDVFPFRIKHRLFVTVWEQCLMQ